MVEYRGFPFAIQLRIYNTVRPDCIPRDYEICAPPLANVVTKFRHRERQCSMSTVTMAGHRHVPTRERPGLGSSRNLYLSLLLRANALMLVPTTRAYTPSFTNLTAFILAHSLHTSSLCINESAMVIFWLNRAGKCPFELGRLPVAPQLKRTLLRFSDFNGKHDRCWNGNCKDLLDGRRPLPEHINVGCICDFIYANNADLQAVIIDGKVALFTVEERDGKSTLEVSHVAITSLQNLDYVAISHARSAGLGNTRFNGLPRCKLIYIQENVNRLFPERQAPTPFWLDTLCLPTESWARRNTTASISSIFQKAAKVLVIDPTLSGTTPLRPRDAVRLIRRAAWSRRVWTIWEAMIPGPENLVFQFASSTIACDKLQDVQLVEPMRVRNPPISTYRITKDFSIESDKLAATIVRLYWDMAVWGRYFNASSQGLRPREQGRYFDKLKIYEMMRLGCLSSPKFGFLRTERETQLSHVVYRNIVRVYGGSTSGGLGSTVDDVQTALSRLSSIENTDLWA